MLILTGVIGPRLACVDLVKQYATGARFEFDLYGARVRARDSRPIPAKVGVLSQAALLEKTLCYTQIEGETYSKQA